MEAGEGEGKDCGRSDGSGTRDPGPGTQCNKNDSTHEFVGLASGVLHRRLPACLPRGVAWRGVAWRGMEWRGVEWPGKLAAVHKGRPGKICLPPLPCPGMLPTFPMYLDRRSGLASPPSL